MKRIHKVLLTNLLIGSTFILASCEKREPLPASTPPPPSIEQLNEPNEEEVIEEEKDEVPLNFDLD